MSQTNNKNSDTQPLHDILIAYLCKNKTQVAVHLQTGIKLCGEIEAHDERIITLKDNQKTQIIYKHAISTIVPDINN